VNDRGNQRIQRFDSDGSFLNRWGESGTSEGQFFDQAGVAVDSAGNFYVADALNQRIQKFNSAGTFLLMWGWGVQDGSSVFQTCASGCQAGINGTGDGQFDQPWGVAVDNSGNIYVADLNNHRVQKFDSSINFVTKWGIQGGNPGQLFYPTSVAIDSDGDVYVTDGQRRVQKFNSLGTFLYQWGSPGTGEGQFNVVSGVAIDAAGDVYVSDWDNHRIQKFDNLGNFLFMWGWGVEDGSSTFQTCTSGCQEGLAGAGDGQFDRAADVAVDAAGNVYVIDQNNHRVLKFGPALEYFIGEVHPSDGR
jgi:DNA-binding beta-propeller fold protein YncE